MRHLLILTLLVSLSSKAQIILEPCLGMNYSWTSQLDQLGHDYKPGYRPVIGVGTDFYLGPRLDFTPKVLYSAKGNNEKSGGGTLIRVVNYNSYIALPIEFKYTLKNEFKINAGVNVSYWLKSSSYSKSETNGWQKAVYTFNNPALQSFQRDNRLELAARLGIRFESPFMDGKLKWELNFNYGLVPLIQPKSPPVNYEYIYNRWLQLLLVYPLKLIK